MRQDYQSIYFDRLEEAVIELGFKNVAQFIKYFGLNKPTIYAIKRLKMGPSSQTMAEIAKTGVNVHFLVSGEFPKTLIKSNNIDESRYKITPDSEIDRLTDTAKNVLYKKGVIARPKIVRDVQSQFEISEALSALNSNEQLAVIFNQIVLWSEKELKKLQDIISALIKDKGKNE